MKLAKFSKLCLGAKFSYFDSDSSNVYVKLGADKVAEWDEEQIDTDWKLQGIYSFGEDPDNKVYLVEDLV